MLLKMSFICKVLNWKKKHRTNAGVTRSGWLDSKTRLMAVDLTEHVFLNQGSFHIKSIFTTHWL